MTNRIGVTQLRKLMEEEHDNFESNIYGKLNKVNVYYLLKILFFIKTTFKQQSKIRNLPIKINVEIDESKIKNFPEKEQQFYRDCVKNGIALGGNEVIEIYEKVLEDTTSVLF